jgi:hypothetical protein
MKIGCPECGAALADDRTCADDFHQLLFWENERPELGEVHHLLVLCYHLQHPSLYSAEGLAHARQLLDSFVAGGLSPAEARRRQRVAVDSGARGWSVTARAGNQGSYGRQPAWTMRAADVVTGGMDTYMINVQAWAVQVHRTLMEGKSHGTARTGRGQTP